MVAKVQLINQGNFYYVLTFLSSNGSSSSSLGPDPDSEQEPKYQTIFPYDIKLRSDQARALGSARNFGKNIAKEFSVFFEEKLKNT